MRNRIPTFEEFVNESKDYEKFCDFGCGYIGTFVKNNPSFDCEDFYDYCSDHNKACRDSGELQDICKDEILRLAKAFKPSEKINESSDRILTLYHGTSSRNLVSIKKNGLDINASTNKNIHGFNTQNQISLTFDYSTAYYYGTLFAKSNEPVTILEIKMPHSFGVSKGLSYNEIIVKENVSPDFIQGAYDKDKLVKLNDLNSYKTYVNPSMLKNADKKHYENTYKVNESIEALERMGCKRNGKPSIFCYTIYRLPSADEFKEFEEFPELTADQIVQGFSYTMIGRGIKGTGNTKLIKDSIEKLVELYPNNSIYIEALKIFNSENAK